jgi:hypothetical protein
LHEKKTYYKRNKYESMNFLSARLAFPKHKGEADDGAYFDGPNQGTRAVDIGVFGPPTSLPLPK